MGYICSPSVSLKCKPGPYLMDTNKRPPSTFIDCHLFYVNTMSFCECTPFIGFNLTDRNGKDW